MDRLTGINAKLDRAFRHIRDLDAEVQAFLSANPYDVASKPHIQLPETVTTFYVCRADEVWSSVQAIAGDALQNMRSSLDHLMWQLAEVSGKVPDEHTSFPIFDPSERGADFLDRKIRPLKPAIQKIILEAKPYKGGNDVLWTVHDANRIDKHRLLVTVASAFKDFGVELNESQWKGIAPEIPVAPGFSHTHYFPMSPRCPIELNDEIFHIPRKLREDENLKFRFQVAFGEPGIFEGKPLVESCFTMFESVKTLAFSFEPFLV
jgi:hypothetical protein